MTPMEFLDGLKEILLAAPESERSVAKSDDGESEDTVLYIQPTPDNSTVRQRVGYILNRWLQDFYEADFDGNSSMRKAFSEFGAMVDKGLLVLLETAIKKGRESRRVSLAKQGHSLPAFGDVETSKKKALVKLLALHPLEVARQLTLIDFRLFEAVEGLDFLRASKDNGKGTTVRGLTTRFNKTSAWIATEVVQNPSSKERGQKIKFFISVAMGAMEIKNYNLLMSILAGLNNAAVQRMKKSWKHVSSNAIQAFENMEKLMSPEKNYQAYRQALAAADFPKLPYFGVFLRDLQFIDVGNETWVDKEKRLVNFSKITMMEGLLRELENFKTYTEYVFTPVPVLQNYLEVLPSLDDDSLYKKSVQLEPMNTSGPNYLLEEEQLQDM